MKFVVDTGMEIIHGSPRKKFIALATLACWFAMGAYIASTITFYVAADVPHSLVAGVGGAVGVCVATVVACLKLS